MISISTTVII